MTGNELMQITAFLGMVLLMVKPLGSYIADLLQGRKTMLSRVLGPLERGIYRTCGIDPPLACPGTCTRPLFSPST